MSTPVRLLLTALHRVDALVHTSLARRATRPLPAGGFPRWREAGQATAEYALVLLGVAAVALMLTAWAAKTGKISRLFDAVVDQLITKAR
jgi:hypothetical protein